MILGQVNHPGNVCSISDGLVITDVERVESPSGKVLGFQASVGVFPNHTRGISVGFFCLFFAMLDFLFGWF